MHALSPKVSRGPPSWFVRLVKCQSDSYGVRQLSQMSNDAVRLYSTLRNKAVFFYIRLNNA